MNITKLKLKNKLLFTLIMGAITVALLSMFTDLGDLLDVLVHFDLRYLPVILLLAPINYILRFVKWHYYLKLVGVAIPLGESLLIFLSGFSMTITPGKVGEILKPYMLKQRYGIPVSATAPIVFAERLTDGISMVILSGIGLLAFNYGKAALAAVAIPMVAMVLLVQNRSLCERVLSMLAKVPVLGKLSVQMGNFYRSTYALVQPKSLLFAVMLGVISWGFEGFVVFFVVRAIGFELSPLLSLFVVSFSAIIGAVTLLPGGLFAAEGSIIGLLILMGIPSAASVGTTLITRFSTLWLGVLVGVVAVLVACKRGYLQPQNPQDQQESAPAQGQSPL